MYTHVHSGGETNVLCGKLFFREEFRSCVKKAFYGHFFPIQNIFNPSFKPLLSDWSTI